eukprot:TRINITY_DN807_c0_g1_i1.p1 TRINITY_DN807_c0_g1~~TRINITY_DN807_c0_g1_i1.p1  ORF type:complete len:297 (-),score=11.97 TRINITY_DN807_c0_g1_i1:394-1284(-)
MGQSSSVNAQVSLDNPVIYAGQTLSGIVTAAIQNEIQDVKISLMVSGVARTKVTKGGGQYTRIYRQDHHLLRLIIPLSTGALSAGMLQKRFQVLLPADLSPSLEYVSYYSRESAKVEYQIIVLADTQVISTYYFYVYQAPFTTCPAPEINIDQLSVGACCCFSPSSVEVTAKLDRGVAYLGEYVKVNYEAVNYSKQKFKKIKVTLRQLVIVKADEHSNYENTILDKKVVQLVQGQSIQQEFYVGVPLQLKVPTLALPTFKCAYFVDIGLGTGCGQGLISLPITISNTRPPRLNQTF